MSAWVAITAVGIGMQYMHAHVARYIVVHCHAV